MPLYVRTLLATGPPEEVRSASVGHREQLRALRDAGKLHAAGEFGKGDGFLEIIDAEDRLEAEKIARESPLVQLGLGSWTLREWAPIEFD